MMENSDDLALETLLSVRLEIAPDLDEELLRRCYEIQKKHQFSRERSHSAQAMDRLIEDRVNALVAASGKDDVAR
jgi:hypothetical protein